MGDTVLPTMTNNCIAGRYLGHYNRSTTGLETGRLVLAGIIAWQTMALYTIIPIVSTHMLYELRAEEFCELAPMYIVYIAAKVVFKTKCYLLFSFLIVYYDS